jgi:hypothetical protein
MSRFSEAKSVAEGVDMEALNHNERFAAAPYALATNAKIATKWHTLPAITNRCQTA